MLKMGMDAGNYQDQCLLPPSLPSARLAFCSLATTKVLLDPPPFLSLVLTLIEDHRRHVRGRCLTVLACPNGTSKYNHA